MIEKIRKLYWAEPFKPFTIHLLHGRSLTVMNRELIAISPTERYITVFDANDASHSINLSLVTDVVAHAEAA